MLNQQIRIGNIRN